MPKKEINYICDVCGSKYQKEDMATKCEKTHYTVSKITKVDYDKFDRKKIYPDSINVELKNGNGDIKIIQYFRQQ